MANIQLTFLEMRAKADELEGENKELRRQAEDLKSQQRSLTGMWDGVANDEFDKAFNSDMIQFENFSRLIDDYVRALRSAADEYERMEKANQRIAQQRTYK